MVGPVGGLTNLYRSLANEAAAEASAAGAEVTKVYSPNATWSAVRHAIDGASIVVYLGHGNGWPSPYRDSLYPPTQNGFGLNPYSGGDDSSHQYFGESTVDNVKLAPNAVVLLSHLCYASGNSEPGLAEGTQSMAIQRADNYAAGFIRAGAEAVVAEAHMGPAYYVRQLLRSQNSIEQIWHDSPSNNGNTMTLTSQRSRGFSERLDPDRPSGGYYRSLVSQGVSSNQVRSGATGTFSGTTAGILRPPVTPSLVSLGLTFGSIDVRTAPIAATRSQLILPVAAKGAKKIPEGTQVGIRWDPIMLDARPALVGRLIAARGVAIAIRVAVDLDQPVAIGDGGALGVTSSHRPARRQPHRPRAARLGGHAHTGGPHRQGPQRRRHVSVRARAVPARHDAARRGGRRV